MSSQNISTPESPITFLQLFARESSSPPGTLTPWQIAFLIVAPLLGLILVATAIFCVPRHRASRREEQGQG